MKTSRIFRIFMMALDTLLLAVLHLFRKFSHLTQFQASESVCLEDPPHATERTQPDRLGIRPELEVDGQPTETYQRSHPIAMGEGVNYAGFEGVVTFRGDNYRSSAAYGDSSPSPRKLQVKWSVPTGKLQKGYGHGFWTGSGWTGQPLLVRWTQEQKSSMENMFPDKREKSGLIEAIYSTMDGNLYFLDIEDGSPTREPIFVGLPFKGAGALHPSLPMVHLGAGDSGPGKEEYARAFLYSLQNGEKLLEYGGQDPFSLRVFHGYDSSPLFDARTDTIIEPGENGILYTFRLGTTIDAQTGRISLHPAEKVKLRYSTSRSSEQRYWLGMEDSAVIWKNYIYVADNGGNLLCIDLNTMQLIWAQDVADDTNGSPVFSVEDGVPYLYIATSLHWTAGKLKLGDVPIFKINAINGEYVWKRSYFCNTIAGVSGGIQATPVVGKGNISNLAIFPVARTPWVRSGLLVALDKQTGREVWRLKLPRYAWSSPLALYDSDGRATLVQGDSRGTLYLIDGVSGKVLDKVNLGSNIEASPAAFGNMIVVGTRGMKIFGIEVQA